MQPHRLLLETFRTEKVIPVRFEGFLDSLPDDADPTREYDRVLHVAPVGESTVRLDDVLAYYAERGAQREPHPMLSDVYPRDQYHLDTNEAVQHNTGCILVWHYGTAQDDRGSRFAHAFFRVYPNIPLLFREGVDAISGRALETLETEAGLYARMMQMLPTLVLRHCVEYQLRLERKVASLLARESAPTLYDAHGARVELVHAG